MFMLFEQRFRYLRALPNIVYFVDHSEDPKFSLFKRKEVNMAKIAKHLKQWPVVPLVGDMSYIGLNILRESPSFRTKEGLDYTTLPSKQKLQARYDLAADLDNVRTAHNTFTANFKMALSRLEAAPPPRSGAATSPEAVQQTTEFARIVQQGLQLLKCALFSAPLPPLFLCYESSLVSPSLAIGPPTSLPSLPSSTPTPTMRTLPPSSSTRSARTRTWCVFPSPSSLLLLSSPFCQDDGMDEATAAAGSPEVAKPASDVAAMNSSPQVPRNSLLPDMNTGAIRAKSMALQQQDLASSKLPQGPPPLLLPPLSFSSSLLVQWPRQGRRWRLRATRWSCTRERSSTI